MLQSTLSLTLKLANENAVKEFWKSKFSSYYSLRGATLFYSKKGLN